MPTPLGPVLPVCKLGRCAFPTGCLEPAEAPVCADGDKHCAGGRLRTQACAVLPLSGCLCPCAGLWPGCSWAGTWKEGGEGGLEGVLKMALKVIHAGQMKGQLPLVLFLVKI